MNNEKQREYFRLAYPQVHRPVLSFDYDQYDIEDISEFGIKIIVDSDDPTFAMGDHVMAMIVFPEGREFDIGGHVVRIQDGYVGLQLDTPLPQSLIRSEAMQVLYNQPEQ
ncbi:MAG: PilZ domain-containing protein [Gammaproteobacteria bacterium]|nr:PilZ domain-containing protein [Gammaproteobacteria bacterium]